MLIHAAAGGVGHLAVQLAKAYGAHVIGTASAAHHAFLAALGVDQAVDYRTTEFTDVVHDVDVVLDTIGGEYQLRSLETLRPGGIMVSTLPRPTRGLWDAVARHGVRAELILVEADQAGMQTLAKLAADGKLIPHIAQTFPLTPAAEAHAAGETGRTVGKMVLLP